jgi:hypothetical protein
MLVYKSIRDVRERRNQQYARCRQLQPGLFTFVTAPSLSGVTGSGNGRLRDNPFVVSGYHRFAICAVLTWHTATAPQHVDTVIATALGAETAYEAFTILK